MIVKLRSRSSRLTVPLERLAMQSAVTFTKTVLTLTRKRAHLRLATATQAYASDSIIIIAQSLSEI